MKRVSHRPDQGRNRLERGDEDVWPLMSSIPAVSCAGFVPPGLKDDAKASDKREPGEPKKKKGLILLGWKPELACRELSGKG